MPKNQEFHVTENQFIKNEKLLRNIESQLFEGLTENGKKSLLNPYLTQTALKSISENSFHFIFNSVFKLVNGDIIYIPEGYNSTEQLKGIMHRNNFHDFNSNISNLKATHQLQAGKKYKVEFFDIIDNSKSSFWSFSTKKRVRTLESEVIMAFLKSRGVIFVGVSGLSLLYELKPEIFSVERWNLSFDYIHNLFIDRYDEHGVPGIYRGAHDDWAFMPVHSYEKGFTPGISTIVCFYKVL